MRFIDYNGTGRIDPQDIATSIAVDEAAREEVPDEKPSSQQLSSNTGCATVVVLFVLPILIIIAAL